MYDDISMYDEIIMYQKTKAEKAKLFLNYIKTIGFDSKNFQQILELNQDVKGSVSLHLAGHNKFLLSKKVKYSELHDKRINGAMGFVSNYNLCIPRSKDADDHFFGGWLPKGSYTRPKYSYPRLNSKKSEFDATISNGISIHDKFDLILNSGMDFFIGDILDFSHPEYKTNKSILLRTLYSLKTPDSNILIDSVSSNVYILAKRQK